MPLFRTELTTKNEELATSGYTALIHTTQQQRTSFRSRAVQLTLSAECLLRFVVIFQHKNDRS